LYAAFVVGGFNVPVVVCPRMIDLSKPEPSGSFLTSLKPPSDVVDAVQLSIPLPSVESTCPPVPSAGGNAYTTLAVAEADDVSVVVCAPFLS
jgi:hypothetical protein